MRLQFTTALPPTLNRQINKARDHWSKSARIKRQWTNQVCIETWEFQKFPDKVWMEFVWLTPDLNADPDNIAAAAKYIMDGLVESKVLKDDSLAVVQSPIVHHYTKGKNEVIVTISDRPIYQLIKLPEDRSGELIHRPTAEKVGGVAIE